MRAGRRVHSPRGVEAHRVLSQWQGDALGQEGRVVALKVFGRPPLYLATTSDVQKYLDEIFHEEKKTGYMTAECQVIHGSDPEIPENVLQVGIDYESGYGAVLWYCDGEMRERVAVDSSPDVAEHVWVSWNPSPPEVDPQVLSDPWCPSYFNRISAIPLDVFRSVIEEYFRSGTGFRPEGVQWVKGQFTGELYEEVDSQ
ncbi:Imm1 family immunity protein [Streptomyces sp. NPDC006186]|uniref:Imm1 family immunity protein n=1 Tax=Streptomyces sp. NPDC006186 TaxID=3155248 RepID=UPI0033AAB519